MCAEQGKERERPKVQGIPLKQSKGTRQKFIIYKKLGDNKYVCIFISESSLEERSLIIEPVVPMAIPPVDQH